ncbi:MAG: GerMN domain-containing protein [Acidaminococcaceae bacterium]|nr:GerMN domain-containing protein [Acidaminococcaceae bacterium]
MKKFIFIGLLICSFIIAGCDTVNNVKPPAQGTDKNPVSAPAVKEKLSFLVYRPADDGSEKLLAENIIMEDNGKSLPENALLTLLSTKPKAAGMTSNIPDGTRLLQLQIKDGLATADFSREIAKKGQGSHDELMLVYSIVNTLTEFKEIKKVRFLVEGQQVITFSGHMDLEDPLQRNETLLK